jgi:two-component system LytT family response regulator
MNIRCLVVGDEPLAQNILLNYIQRIEYLSVIGTCSDASEALRLLLSNNIDVIFLDIKLPEVDGVHFLNSIEKKPYIIFTTAHHNYAFNGFEQGAVDFLLKPVTFDRFIMALSRLQEKILADASGRSAEILHKSNAFVYFKSGRQRLKVYLNEIDYIEGLKDYVKIVTRSQRVVIKSSMKNILLELGTDKFIRVHKSFIVPIQLISKIKGRNIELNSVTIPIGRQYWNEIKKITDGRLRIDGTAVSSASL